ncbi:DUF3383 domain-containing protein, partial [Escherichia coli]|nr:DUF3383 domain-containing protein [Escherichia coli]
MATFREKVATVTLLYGATSIRETQFDIPLILTGQNVTGEAIQYYSSSDALLEAGYGLNDPAYIMAVKLFNGLFPPDQVMVGKREVTNFTLTPIVEDSATYTITIKNGTKKKEFKFIADDTATAQEIVVGLTEMINADLVYGPLFTVANNGAAMTFTPVEGKFGSIDSTGFTQETVYANAITEDIAALHDIDSSWFWTLSDSHETEDVLALAAWVEENDKVYFFSSSEPGIKTKAEDNVLERLNDLGYNNTCFALWMTDADSVFPEAAVVGAICSRQPGLTTLHGKTLVGV